MRDVVFSAADLVVLSFKPGYQGNSGVLNDAISFGCPRRVLRRLDLGGDRPRVQARRHLHARAIRTRSYEPSTTAPAHIGAGDLERARADLSNRAVAVRFLRALLDAPPAGGAQP